MFLIAAFGAIALVGLRGLSRFRRRPPNDTGDLTVSDAWLAEQRGRREER